MRFVWTVAGDDPDLNQGDKYGIDGYYYPAFDSVTTPAQLNLARSHGTGRVIGLYVGHNWFPSDGPDALANRINAEYKRLGAAGVPIGAKGLRVMFNLEQHDPDYIAVCLEKFRSLQPKVNLSWSPEGMQGGWMGPVLPSGQKPATGGFVDRVLKAKVRVVPQGFTGNMTRRAEDVVLRDLITRGLPQSVVSIFYDAAQLPLGWDGYAFTMGRLPWIP